MKKSNWREDLHAPVAVKKVLKEYIQTLPLVAATSKIVPFTTTAKAIGTKGFFSTTAGKLTTGAAVGHAVGTVTDRDRNRRYPGIPHTGHHIGRRQNPR